MMKLLRKIDGERKAKSAQYSLLFKVLIYTFDFKPYKNRRG
jgi:hypothetical protein